MEQLPASPVQHSKLWLLLSGSGSFGPVKYQRICVSEPGPVIGLPSASRMDAVSVTPCPAWTWADSGSTPTRVSIAAADDGVAAARATVQATTSARAATTRRRAVPHRAVVG